MEVPKRSFAWPALLIRVRILNPVTAPMWRLFLKCARRAPEKFRGFCFKGCWHGWEATWKAATCAAGIAGDFTRLPSRVAGIAGRTCRSGRRVARRQFLPIERCAGPSRLPSLSSCPRRRMPIHSGQTRNCSPSRATACIAGWPLVFLKQWKCAGWPMRGCGRARARPAAGEDLRSTFIRRSRHGSARRAGTGIRRRMMIFGFPTCIAPSVVAVRPVGGLRMRKRMRSCRRK